MRAELVEQRSRLAHGFEHVDDLAAACALTLEPLRGLALRGWELERREVRYREAGDPGGSRAASTASGQIHGRMAISRSS